MSNSLASPLPPTGIFNLGNFGDLQVVEVPHPPYGRAFAKIHEMCAASPCNLAFCPMNNYLTPEEAALINQTPDQNAVILGSKTPDGILYSIGDTLISGMFGKSLHESGSNEPIKLFSLGQKPVGGSMYGKKNIYGVTGENNAKVLKGKNKILFGNKITKNIGCNSTFKVILSNDTCHPHEISRNCTTQHALAQLLAARSPCPQGTPHVVFESPNLGSLSTRILRGNDAHALKTAFLQLIANQAMKGRGVYNKNITLTPDLCKLLMLKKAKGEVCCDRCADGIVGYRMRNHNKKKTFLFVVNSNDFHADEPVEPENALVQVIKMAYADTSKKGKRFVVVNPDEGEDDNCGCGNEEEEEEDDDEDGEDNDDGEVSYEDHLSGISNNYEIPLNKTVQEILNHVEMGFRKSLLEHHKCHLFPAYCDMLNLQQGEAPQANSLEYYLNKLQLTP